MTEDRRLTAEMRREPERYMVSVEDALHDLDLADAGIAELQIRAQVAERACGELRAELEKMQAELADWKEAARIAAEEPCEDERHCTCVPLLRTTIAQQTAFIATRCHQQRDGLAWKAAVSPGASEQV